MSSFKHPKWQIALWEKNTVEPAILRVPIVVIIFIFCWGLSLWTLHKMRVEYGYVLSIKSPPFGFIFYSAIFLIVQYAFSMTIASNALGLTIETGISCFYTLLALSLVIPKTPGSDARIKFYRLLWKVFFPVGSVSFPEILLADAMTSLSKVFKDCGVTLVAIYSFVTATDIVDYHNHAMVGIALLASLPFWLRVRQCTVQLYGCTDRIARIPIILNILKYCSAFPPIWLAAAASLGYSVPDMPFWITSLATVNSLYSYAWDVVMDWGLITITRDFKVITGRRTLLPWPVYPCIVVLNFLLRFSWMLNRMPGMDKLHSSVLVLLIELGEVVRRSVWSVFRVEWEVLVQGNKAAGGGGGVNSPSSLALQQQGSSKDREALVLGQAQAGEKMRVTSKSRSPTGSISSAPVFE